MIDEEEYSIDGPIDLLVVGVVRDLIELAAREGPHLTAILRDNAFVRGWLEGLTQGNNAVLILRPFTRRHQMPLWRIPAFWSWRG
jgi:hypothetical protein